MAISHFTHEIYQPKIPSGISIHLRVGGNPSEAHTARYARIVSNNLSCYGSIPVRSIQINRILP